MKKEYYEEEGIIVSYHLLNYLYNQFKNGFTKDIKLKMEDLLNSLTNYMNHDFDEIKKDIINQELYRKVTFETKKK